MTIKRLNYFRYQFLQEGEFQDAQTYQRDMRLLHHRSSHTWGIVSGMEVTGSAQMVTIGEGVANDQQGREIVIETDTDVAIPSGRLNADFYLVVEFHEDDENEDFRSTQPTLTDQFTRVVETYTISWPSTPPGSAENKIVLARIHTDGSGDIAGAPDMSVRTEAGAKLGERADIGELKFRLKGRNASDWPGIKASLRTPAGGGVQNIDVTANKTSFSGDVDVSGALRVSTIVKQTEIQIDDNIITVNTYPAQSTPRNVNGGLEVFRGGTAPNAQVIWDESAGKWKIGTGTSLDFVARATEVLDPTSGHKHTGAAGDGATISHASLNTVQGADTTSTDTSQNKHVSNAQSKAWQGHVNITSGNPHNTAHADLGSVLGASSTSTDTVQNKHVSNAQSKAWQDHVNVTSGNPHNTTAAMIGALAAADYGFAGSAVAGVVFTQLNGNGAASSVPTSFRPKFIWVTGYLKGVLGGVWFGTPISGYADVRTSYIQRGTGANIVRYAVAPFWSIDAASYGVLCGAQFSDLTVSPNQIEDLSVSISAVTGAGLTLMLSRSVPTAGTGATTGYAALAQFNISLQLLCFG